MEKTLRKTREFTPTPSRMGLALCCVLGALARASARGVQIRADDVHHFTHVPARLVDPGVRGNAFAHPCEVAIGILSVAISRSRTSLRTRAGPPVGRPALRRQAMRESVFRLPGAGSEVRFAFVLGLDAEGRPARARELAGEVAAHRDLAWVEAPDGMIAAKTFAWFFAATSELPPTVRFVGKMDDDTFVQPAQLLADVRALPPGGLHYVGNFLFITAWVPATDRRSFRPCAFGGMLDSVLRPRDLGAALRRRRALRCGPGPRSGRSGSQPARLASKARGDTLNGAFAYALGPLYALSLPLGRAVFDNDRVRGLLLRLALDNTAEDLLLGRVVHVAMHGARTDAGGGRNFTLAHLTATKLINVGMSQGHVVECSSAPAAGAPGARPEAHLFRTCVSPWSYVVHQVKTDDAAPWQALAKFLGENASQPVFPLVPFEWSPRLGELSLPAHLQAFWTRYHRTCGHFGCSMPARLGALEAVVGAYNPRPAVRVASNAHLPSAALR